MALYYDVEKTEREHQGLRILASFQITDGDSTVSTFEASLKPRQARYLAEKILKQLPRSEAPPISPTGKSGKTSEGEAHD